ncbi:MAG: hypothetical protein ACRDIX_07280 [Actinomycetota bacterium]
MGVRLIAVAWGLLIGCGLAVAMLMVVAFALSRRRWCPWCGEKHVGVPDRCRRSRRAARIRQSHVGAWLWGPLGLQDEPGDAHNPPLGGGRARSGRGHARRGGAL